MHRLVQGLAASDARADVVPLQFWEAWRAFEQALNGAGQDPPAVPEPHNVLDRDGARNAEAAPTNASATPHHPEACP